MLSQTISPATFPSFSYPRNSWGKKRPYVTSSKKRLGFPEIIQYKTQIYIQFVFIYELAATNDMICMTQTRKLGISWVFLSLGQSLCKKHPQKNDKLHLFGCKLIGVKSILLGITCVYIYMYIFIFCMYKYLHIYIYIL